MWLDPAGVSADQTHGRASGWLPMAQVSANLIYFHENISELHPPSPFNKHGKKLVYVLPSILKIQIFLDLYSLLQKVSFKAGEIT